KGDAVKTATLKNSLDPTLASSWIEIHPDNTILIRTGKSDFGQGTTYTAYRQIVADELSVPFEAITLRSGGRYRPHAGRKRRVRFSRPGNSEHSEGRRIYASGSPRSCLRAPRRAQRPAFRQR